MFLTCYRYEDWSCHGQLPKPVHCTEIQCSEDRTALAHGRAICTDSNFYLSECRYFCNAGYQFEGRVPTAGRSGFPTGRCLSNRTWSSPAVTCVKKLCTPAVTDLERVSFKKAWVEFVCCHMLHNCHSSNNFSTILLFAPDPATRWVQPGNYSPKFLKTCFVVGYNNKLHPFCPRKYQLHGALVCTMLRVVFIKQLAMNKFSRELTA